MISFILTNDYIFCNEQLAKKQRIEEHGQKRFVVSRMSINQHKRNDDGNK